MEDLITKNDQPEKDIKKEELPKKQDIGLLLACMLLGAVSNILFYKEIPGISYPIFVLCFYAVFLWRQRHNFTYNLSFGWLLSVPVIMLSFTYFIYSNEVFWILNLMGIPILIIAQTVLLSKANRYKWFQGKFVEDILYGMFYRTLSYISKPFGMLKGLIVKKGNSGKYNTLNKVLIGLLISLPLVLIVVMLLTSADQVFGNLFGNIPQYLENINFFEFLIRICLILLVSTVTFSYIWSFIPPKTGVTTDAAQEKGAPARIWDTVIVITVLVSINLIYVVFTSIQFAYLFGGGVPDGFTYSEYARRGFFELILVTLINLVILLCNINLKKDGGNALNLTTKVLNSLLVACTAIMLISAHYRMSMYEEAYGYTYLRLLTHAFMAFIFVLLIIALVKVWSEKAALLKAYIITALVAYVLINYMNIDMIIAKNNIHRYEITNKIDAYYLTQLSYDVVPIIVPLLNDQNKEISLQAENGLYLKKEQLKNSRSWQSFNISKYRAEKILSEYDLKSRPGSYIR